MEVGTENHALTLGRNRPGAGKTLRANPGNVVGRAFTEGAGNPKGSCQRPGRLTGSRRQAIPLGRKSSAVSYPTRGRNDAKTSGPEKNHPLMGELCPDAGGWVGLLDWVTRSRSLNEQFPTLRTSLRDLGDSSGREVAHA
jgi:hypothetical protein